MIIINYIHEHYFNTCCIPLRYTPSLRSWHTVCEIVFNDESHRCPDKRLTMYGTSTRGQQLPLPI